MKISLSWLSEYIDIAPLKSNLSGVLHELTMRGLEVESVTDLSKGLAHVCVAQVLSKEAHPNASKLSLCKVSDGKETLQIVCGAQNFKAMDKVLLSKIGAQLPNGLKIAASKIRDVESFGMLCSESELGLAAESEGIVIVDPQAVLGTPAAQYLGKDDVVFEINVTPNRGDALSYRGVARELALILGQKVKDPTAKVTEGATQAVSKISVSIDAPEDCYQYHARLLENVNVGPSPVWLKNRLESVGLRSINNIVDVTNFVLMEFGTPLHAFDASLVEKNSQGLTQIHARLAKEGESLPLLDGTQVTLSGQDLVISDSKKAIALAGVMGGGNSEVSDSTKTILIEAAEFAASRVRKSARRHQKHTDASHRFERQIDSKSVLLALERAASLMAEVSGAIVCKGVVSQKSTAFAAREKRWSTPIAIATERLNDRLGTSISSDEAIAALAKAGFSSKKSTNDASVIEVVPNSYRSDVGIEEDVYEEVLRVLGYDRVPAVLPALRALGEKNGVADSRANAMRQIKRTLSQLGFSECVNFAFTSEQRVHEWSEPETSKHSVVTLKNPLNEELSTLKTSLLSGLFQNFVSSTNHQQSDLRLFELRPIFLKDESQESGVREEWRIAVMMSGRSYSNALGALDKDVDFFDLKGVLESVCDSVNVKGLRYQEAAAANRDRRFHPFQSVRILLGKGPCGVMGRIHPSIESSEKLRTELFAFEVSFDRIWELMKGDKKFTAISKFPKVTRDFSFLISKDILAEKVIASIQKLARPLLESVTVVDLYEGEKIPAGQRSLSLSIVLADPQRTLEDAEVDALSQKLIAGLEKETGAKLRLE